MGGYIANFTVYTMAMTGLICFAVFIYKKVMDGTMRGDNTKFLSVEESMSLSPRKTLHIVRAGNEKFLIASDIDRTTLISKLNSSAPVSQKIIDKYENIRALENLNPSADSIYTPAENKIQRQQQTVRLDPIKTQVRSTVQMDRRMPNHKVENSNSKSVTLDFDKQTSHGFATMKEMAKKINEL